MSLLSIVWLLRQGTVVGRAQTSTPPEFPSQVELITLDVVVSDGKGKPVGGLTQNHFVVEEDGQRQEIENFEAVSLSTQPEATAPEPSAIATSASTRKTGRGFAIVADDLGVQGKQTPQLREAVATMIDKSLGLGDAVVLGTTSGEAWWSGRIPSGREDLLAVLGRVQGRLAESYVLDRMTDYEAFWLNAHEDSPSAAPPQPDRSDLIPSGSATEVPDPLGTSIKARVIGRWKDAKVCEGARSCEALIQARATEIDAQRRARAHLTLSAVHRGIGELAGIRGRKSLILVSQGFLDDSSTDLREVATTAREANAAIYFVDLDGPEAFRGWRSVAEAEVTNDPRAWTTMRYEERVLESAGAQFLVEQTGGFSVRNAKDLASAVERIAVESRTFYLLGFHPPAGKPPGVWRKLRVAVDRKDVTTRARPGYRLYGASAGAITRSGTETLVPLRLASYVLEPLATERNRVVTVTEIDVSGLVAGSLDVARPPLQLRLEATPRDGGKTQAQDVSLQWARGSAPENPPTGSDWRLARLESALPPGVYRVRAFVRDPASGRTGQVEQRILVPDMTVFRVSTPVLSDQVTASVDAQSSVSPAPVAHEEFSPTAARPLLATFEVLGAAKDPATGQSRIETRFVLEDQTGHPLAAPPASALVPSPEGRLQQVIALPQLPGGQYALVITVDDRVAGNSQEVRRGFSVREPPASAAAEAPSSLGPVTAATPELTAILDRAAQYVLAYGQELTNIVAEEECRQVYAPGDLDRQVVRTIRAGVLFVSLPGPVPWATFRDVWEVDGNKIRDRADRLVRLFRDSPATAHERARAILEESARFNLGPVRRTLNIPTLALLFLHHENQYRFAFQLKGERSFHGTKVRDVAFSERVRPALVVGETGAGAPVRGRLWIDPQQGTVLKTDAEYDIDPLDPYHRSRAHIVTEYRRDPTLRIVVPDLMEETYESLVATGGGGLGVALVQATTRYSGYLRFSVTTEERVIGLPHKLQ
ncbi:MAG TPA: VWA domain-containing protein [Vicinamibacteria bacterium]|jgi:VWFA-related protein|nr:VWA domain-containing protein [Vicinamibacteria bacterium]